MLTCGSDAEATCEVSEDGLSISLAKPMDSGNLFLKLWLIVKLGIYEPRNIYKN